MGINEGLIDGFRHNAWASREVLAVCATLTDEQLDAEVTGTFGTIRATLRHTISAESNYYRALAGEEPAWFARVRSAEPVSVADLSAYNDELETRWLRFLADPFDADRIFVRDWNGGVQRDVPAGVILMQALHHANEHRTQVNTTLTAIGVRPPELGVWEWAEASDRAPLHRA